MLQSYDPLTILRIAKDYYINDLSQQEISVKEKIHRTQISRILKEARELGYIQFSLSIPVTRDYANMAKRLEIEMGLRQVVIACGDASSQSKIDPLGFYAAQYIEKTFPSCRNIGIGTGKTLFSTSQYLSDIPCETPPTFISACGTSGIHRSYLQSSVVLESFSCHFGGQRQFNNFPIFFTRKKMTDLEIARFEDLQQQYKKLDTVVLSVGGPIDMKNPYFEEFSIISSNYHKKISQACGEILGHLLFEDNINFAHDAEYVIPAISLATLNRIPNVICIARGSEKVEAIIEAAKHQYIKILITDEDTASMLLKHIKIEAW